MILARLKIAKSFVTDQSTVSDPKQTIKVVWTVTLKQVSF